MDLAARVFDSVFDMLPDEQNPSPMVRIRKLNPSTEFELYAKLEWTNPLGSVKDRAAWAMLQDLEKRGELSAHRGIVEPTSGNTGISLAAMARARGYSTRAVVPNRIPEEKKVLLRAAGADLDVVSDELCPAPGLGEGSINLAKTHARASSDRYVMPNQYENELNVEAHRTTTGPELWRQTQGRVTHVFVSLGTCGTASGVARFLKDRGSAARVIAVQPSEGHDVPGLRNVRQLGACRLFDPSLIHEILEIDYELAYTRAVDLLRNEGLRAGPSSGLVFEGARRVIERDRQGVGVMIFADDLFKYTSSMARHIPQLTGAPELAPTASRPEAARLARGRKE